MNTDVAEDPHHELLRIHWAIAALITGFFVFLLFFWSTNFFSQTWSMFVQLRWRSLWLLINPLFHVWWTAGFTAMWECYAMICIPWAEGNERFRGSRGKLLVYLMMPIVSVLLLQFLGPYFFPTYPSRVDGHLILRILPFFGGRGFEPSW